MSLHRTGLVSRHQLDHPNDPAVPSGPTLETVLKFNPNHGPDGRFTSHGGGGGGRRGGTEGPPTTGAFGQRLNKTPAPSPKELGQAAERAAAHIQMPTTAHALRNRVNAIAPGKRLDYAESRANRVTDYYKQPLPRANAAAIAADKSKWTPGKSFAEHQANAVQTLEFRKGMAPAQRQTMEYRHGVTPDAKIQQVRDTLQPGPPPSSDAEHEAIVQAEMAQYIKDTTTNAPKARVQAASGLRVPTGYHAAGPVTRTLPPSGGFTSGQDYRRWQASKLKKR